MLVRGFAEFVFVESARLQFARACERCSADVTAEQPQAWVIDERRISFALDAEMSADEMRVYESLLRDLASNASSGEFELRPENAARVFEVIGLANSGIPERASGPQDLGEATPTIPIAQRRRP